MTRRDGQYPYCDLQAGPVPAWLGPEQLELPIRVADDLTAAADRLESCRLWLHLIDAAVEDDIEVTLNSTPLTCANPLVPGTMETPIWLRYEPAPGLVRRGGNQGGIRLLSRDLPRQVQEEAPIEVADVELEIRYLFPEGTGSELADSGPGPSAQSDDAGKLNPVVLGLKFGYPSAGHPSAGHVRL